MLKTFLGIMLFQFGALILPGPDFAIVFRHSILKGKRDGLLCASGVAVAVMINILITYLIGSTLYSQHHLLYIVFIGCGLTYLFYVSFSLIRNFFVLRQQNDNTEQSAVSNINNSFISGLLTNLSNVKAIVFFSALLPLANTFDTTFKILTWVCMGIMTLLWFSFVVIMFGHNRVRQAFMAKIHIFELIIGSAIFIFAGAIFYHSIYKYFVS
jgi:threonine/homoserine/homoserine lactone efflux protein